MADELQLESPQNVADSQESQLGLIDQGTPKAPALSWDKISADVSFKNLNPEHKEAVLSNYTQESRDYLHSLVGADPNAIDKQLQDFHDTNLHDIMDIKPSWGHQLVTNLFYGGDEKNRTEQRTPEQIQTDDEFWDALHAQTKEGDDTKMRAFESSGKHASFVDDKGERPPLAMPIAKAIDAFANKVSGGAEGGVLQKLVETGTEEAKPGAISFTNLGLPHVFGQQKGTLAQIAAGVGNLPIDFANFALSPGATATKGLKILEDAPSLVQRAVALGFTGDQVRQAFHSGLSLQDRVGLIVGAGFGAAGVAKGPEILKSLREPTAKVADAASTYADSLKTAEAYKASGLPESAIAQSAAGNGEFADAVAEARQDFADAFKKISDEAASVKKAEPAAPNGSSSEAKVEAPAGENGKTQITEANMAEVAGQLGLQNAGKLPGVDVLTMSDPAHGGNLSVPVGATLDEVRQLKSAKAALFDATKETLPVARENENNLLATIKARIESDNLTTEQKGGENNGRSNTRQSENRGAGSPVSESPNGGQTDLSSTPSGRTLHEGSRQLEERSTSGARDQTSNAGKRTGEKSRSKLEERGQVNENGGGGNAPAVTPLSKWHQKYEAQQTARAKSSLKEESSPKSETANPSKLGAETPEEAAHMARADLDKQIKLPEGASSIRVTDLKGRKTILSERDLKGANPLHEAGPFEKIEAGTMAKGGKFVPSEEPIALREPKALNAPGSGLEDEEAGREAVEAGAASPTLPSEIAKSQPHSDLEPAGPQVETPGNRPSSTFKGWQSAHEQATIQAAAEALQERGTAPADIADQITKRYSVAKKILEKFGLTGNDGAQAQVFDRLRDDLFRNLDQTGDPFKIQLKSGDVKDYSAALSATHELDSFLRSHEQATRSAWPFHAEEGQPGLAVEQTAAAEAPKEEKPPVTIADVHNIRARALSALSKWVGLPLDAAPEASRDQIVRAAGLVADDIFEKEGGRRLGPELGADRFAGRGRKGTIDALRNDPAFIKAVQDRVVGHIRQDVRAILGRGLRSPGVIDLVRNSLGVEVSSNGERAGAVSKEVPGEPGASNRAVGSKEKTRADVASFIKDQFGDSIKLESSDKNDHFAVDAANPGVIQINESGVEAFIAHREKEGWTREQSIADAIWHEGWHLVDRDAADVEKSATQAEEILASDYGRKLAEDHAKRYLGTSMPGVIREYLGDTLKGEARQKALWRFASEFAAERAETARSGNTNSLFWADAPKSFIERVSAMLNRMWNKVAVHLENVWLPKQFNERLASMREGFNALHDQAGQGGGLLNAPGYSEMRDDATKQNDFLQHFAEAHGFQDVNEFAVEDPQLFNEAARQYRRTNGEAVGTQMLNAPGEAPVTPEVIKEADKRAADLFTRIDAKFDVESKNIVDKAVTAGSSSKEDFAAAFKEAGLTQSASEAVGSAMSAHFRLAALEQAVKDAPRFQAGAQQRSEQETKPITAQVDGEPNATSIQNSKVDEERAKRGLGPAMKSAHKEFEESWKQAVDHIERTRDADGVSTWQEGLIKELRSKARPVTDEENAALLHRQVSLQNAFDKTKVAIDDAQTKGDRGGLAEQRAILAKQLDDLLDLYNINKTVGTEQGRGLATRQMLAKEDYTLANMLTRRRAVRDGIELDSKTVEETTALHKEILDLSTKLFEKEGAADEERAKKVADARIKDIAAKAPKGEKPVDLDAKRQEVTAKMRELMTKEDVDPADLKGSIRKLAEIFVRKGVTERNALVDAVHGIVQLVAPDMTRRETMDAISGYADYKKLSTDAVKAKLRDLRGQMQQAAKIEDFAKENVWGGKGPRRSGVEQRTPSELEADLIKQVEELKRTSDFEARSPEEIKTALQSFKERTQKRITDYEERLANKDFTRKATPPELRVDSEAARLKADLERAKFKFERAVKADQLNRRGPVETGADWLAKWGRAAKLTAISTLGKLMGAAAHRAISNPIEEAVGAGLGKLPGVSTIAKGAETEGGFYAKAEAKRIVTFWSKGFQEASQIFSKGESDLDARFGKRSILPQDITDLPGKLHAMMKAPTKRSSFEFMAEKLTQKVLDAGIDPTEPATQTRIWTESYKYANRQIFMQDNVVVNGMKAWLQGLQRPDKTTGKVNPVGKAIATTTKVLVPIVKVPTNYVGEALQYVSGLPIGSGKILFRALSKSKTLEDFSPAEKDLILRQLKKGSVGGAAMALGFFQPPGVIQGGGFYNPGEKRNPGDLKAGDLQIFGLKVPRLLAHTPLIEAFQFGATIRRVSEEMAKGQPKGLTTGTMAAAMGIVSEAPLAEAVFNTARLREKPADYVGDVTKGILVPGAVQNIANWTDTPGNPFTNSVTKRAPQNFRQRVFDTGVPGLRQRVPKSQRQ